MLQALSVALGQMRDHSRQRTAAARFYFADQTSKKPARMEPTHTAKHTARAGRKKGKQTVKSIRSSKQPNQQNLCNFDHLQL